jgi:hypothetical protein
LPLNRAAGWACGTSRTARIAASLITLLYYPGPAHLWIPSAVV